MSGGSATPSVARNACSVRPANNRRSGWPAGGSHMAGVLDLTTGSGTRLPPTGINTPRPRRKSIGTDGRPTGSTRSPGGVAFQYGQFAGVEPDEMAAVAGVDHRGPAGPVRVGVHPPVT